MERRKVVTIDGFGVISVLSEDIPRPSRGQVLVRVSRSLISPGTELGWVKKRRENPNPSMGPKPFGYGNAGIVIERGEDCGEIPVGAKLACMGGGYALHTTHACVPKNLTEPVPEGVSFEEAAFAHLAATSLHAIRRARLEIGENVLVAGLGIVGQLCGQFAKASGCHVMGMDLYPLRLEIAERCGVDLAINPKETDPVEAAREFSRGYGIDCGIIAFGGDATEAFKQIVRSLKVAPDTHRMGRIVIVGGATITHQFASALGNVDVRSSARPGPGYHDVAWEHGADYPPVFVQWTTKRNLEECLRFIQEGRINVKDLITHRFPIDEAPEACELLINHPESALGVILEME